MAKQSTLDKYANIASVNVTEAVAGTLITSKFAFPFSIMDKMALLIARIEYSFTGVEQLNGTGDKIYAALTVAAAPTNLYNQADPLLVDNCHIDRYDLGAAASGILHEFPLVKDFTDLPGGGLLVAPNPLYAGVQSSGAAGVTGVWIKLFYTYMTMATDEYWQLVESRRIISS